MTYRDDAYVPRSVREGGYTGKLLYALGVRYHWCRWAAKHLL